ncbi:hypothetical protein GGR54DRAFT_634877 [Hypoxylon sp. NC1633]|nr:hypothetical protein GGR54DRAFT_634877 [Hypoxylon sp. NC1633]
MPRATKKSKSTRPRQSSAVSASAQVSSQSQSSSTTTSSSSQSYTWTAADAAKASEDGAFLTAWPQDEPYYAPPIDLFDENYQTYQGQNSYGHQYYHSSSQPSSTMTGQGGSSK